MTGNQQELAGSARRGGLSRLDAPGELVASGGSAIVAVAKVGRILGRSGWRIARQLPGAQAVEREAQRLQRIALQEARRLLDIPQTVFGTASGEEARAVLLLQQPADGQPLRSAMGELLDRSADHRPDSGRDYLFGTIISQLVPDEARIIAVLSDGRPRALVDVLDRSRHARVLLSAASPVGREAGVAEPRNTPTYLARLHGFGLVTTGPEGTSMETEYLALSRDEAVRAAQAAARRPSATRLRRGTVELTELGRQFWAATDPRRPGRGTLPPP